MKNLILGMTVIVGILATAGVGFSGVPCAGTSTVEASPQCGAYCPRGHFGTITVTVTVRDCYGTPLEGKEVVVTPASGTTGRCWCPGASAVTCTTNTNGVATAQFSTFGGCGPTGCSLRFEAVTEGVLLGPSDPVIAASPDNTSDCAVTVTDFTRFAGDYNKVRCCSDLNCSGGAVNIEDFTYFASHYGMAHSCP